MRLALPLIIGQASGVAMGFVDTLMAGRLSTVDLAAVAIGSTIWSSLSLFCIGTLLAIPPMISHYDGAGEHDEVAPFVRQAAWVALMLAVLIFAATRQVEPLLKILGIEAEVVPMTGLYLDAISWGAPGLGLFLVLRFMSDGLGNSRPFMYIGLLGLLLNIPADYVLMYGKLGLPVMGARGCGYATALVLSLQFMTMALYVHRSKRYRFMQLFKHFEAPKFQPLAEILKLGLPIGFSIFIESSMFMVATLLMGTLGTVAIAGHQVAFNFTALIFMVPLGMSMAITVRVGNAMGRGEIAEARFRGLTGLRLTLITQLISAAILITFPAAIAAIYTTDEQVAAVAVSLLFYAAIFQLSDGFQVAAAGALRGLKDTRVPLVFMVLAYWITGIPLSYLLGIRMGHQGAGIWIGLIVGLSVAAIALMARFHLLTKRPTKTASKPVSAH
jgi:MATE family multidrug resistance protein